MLRLPSVLWRCWLSSKKGIRPVKTEWWGAGVVICLELGADLHMAQLMPLPLTVSCFSKIQIGFTFLVPAHLGSPGKGPLKGCVCVWHTGCETADSNLYNYTRTTLTDVAHGSSVAFIIRTITLELVKILWADSFMFTWIWITPNKHKCVFSLLRRQWMWQCSHVLFNAMPLSIMLCRRCCCCPPLSIDISLCSRF